MTPPRTPKDKNLTLVSPKVRRELALLNIYPDIRKGKVYYRYIKGKKRGSLGTDKVKAINTAHVLNSHYAGQDDQDLVNKILQRHSPGDTPIEIVIDEFIAEYLPEKKLAPGTLENKLYKLNKYKRDLKGTPISRITQGFLRKLFQELTQSAYVKHRQLWIEIFRFAIASGYCAVGMNYAEATLQKGEPKRQRMRIKDFATYTAIYNKAEQCVQIAMDYSLVTLQSRLECVNCELKHNNNNRIRIVRQKTGDHISIGVHESLDQIFVKSRKRQMESGVRSPFLVWREPISRRGAKDRQHYTQLTPGYLTKSFKKAVEATGLFADVDRKLWPTFHEIRSFGKQCYRKQDSTPENVQNMMGHEDEKTQLLYDEGHDDAINWKECEAHLDLDKLRTELSETN